MQVMKVMKSKSMHFFAVTLIFTTVQWFKSNVQALVFERKNTTLFTATTGLHFGPPYTQLLSAVLKSILSILTVSSILSLQNASIESNALLILQ